MTTAIDEDHAALRFAAAVRGAALCTIVGIEGSFSRRLGAQLAVGPDGALAGSLADGCLEHELARQAGIARRDGRAQLLRYGAGSPVIDFRLPCGSGLDIVIDPRPDPAELAAAVAELDARRAVTMPLPIVRRGLLAEREYLPATRLIVLGAGPEAAALAVLARCHGFEVILKGPDAGLSLGQAPHRLTADAWTAIVLLFHDHEWETALLDWALGTPAFYIGAQGGAAARDNRREALARMGRDATVIQRVRSPIGLIPRSRDARILALSVLAEVVAAYEVLRG